MTTTRKISRKALTEREFQILAQVELNQLQAEMDRNPNGIQPSR